MLCSEVIHLVFVVVLTLLSIGLLFTYFVFAIIAYGDMKDITSSAEIGERIDMVRVLLLISSFSAIFASVTIMMLAVVGLVKWMMGSNNEREDILGIYSENEISLEEVSDTY